MLKRHTGGDPVKRYLSLFLFLVLGTLPAAAANVPRAIATENSASCDISVSPAATLLLPYFEVDIAKPVTDATNTIFSIINTSRSRHLARVTIWTDYAHP